MKVIQIRELPTVNRQLLLPMKEKLFGEVLLSGGLRHAVAEELCEDAAGIFFFEGGAVFYLADGTSDQEQVGQFSSRYLANSLGYAFIESFLEDFDSIFPDPIETNPSQEEIFPPPSPLIQALRDIQMESKSSVSSSSGTNLNVTKTFHKALERIEGWWKKEFEQLLKSKRSKDVLSQSLEPYKNTATGESGFLKSFSTTFCAGVLLNNGKTLDLVKIGDLDVAVKEKKTELHRLNKHRERMFVSIRTSQDQTKAVIEFPKPSFKERSYRNVEYVVAKTDGVRFVNDDITFKLLEGNTGKSLLDFRKLLLKGYDKRIGDDKSILYFTYI